MRWNRRDYVNLMTFKSTNRPMFVELFGPLVGLKKEWLIQGADKLEIKMEGFKWDYVPTINCGGNTGLYGGETPTVIEENEKYIIKKDELGRETKLFKGKSTLAHPLEYPVEDKESWLKIKPLFEFNKKRIDWKKVEEAKKCQDNGGLVVAEIPGGFDLPRLLMGEEQLCLAYYERPELIYDIIQTIKNTSYKVLEIISKQLTIDNLHVHEDMAGKSGPLIGPRQFKEFIKPYYRKVWDMLSARDTKIFSFDSDGNIEPIIDILIESGVTVIYPMEPAAGMDIVKTRKKYGKKVAFKGGIDKFILKKSKKAIKEELLYKMQPIMKKGGIAFGLDHRIPNGTPLEKYRYYVKLGREILGLPPLEEDEIGWQRMAF